MWINRWEFHFFYGVYWLYKPHLEMSPDVDLISCLSFLDQIAPQISSGEASEEYFLKVVLVPGLIFSSSTNVVQSCAVEVVFVVVYMSYYCNHQAGPLVTSTPGVGVSSSKKKFPQLLHLAKIALLPQVVLLGLLDSLQNKKQGILWSNPNPG